MTNQVTGTTPAGTAKSLNEVQLRTGRGLLSLSMRLTLLFVMLGAAARVLTGFQHNDEMYVTASALVSRGRVLYRDFAYLQTPYLPLLYGFWFKLIHSNSYFLLQAKLFSLAELLLSGTIIYTLSARKLRSAVLAAGLTSVFFLNMNIVDSARETSNYILPLLLTYGAYYFFDRAQRSMPNFGALTLTGLLLAFAVGVKLTYLTVFLPFGAGVLLIGLARECPTRTSVKGLLALTIGYFIGLCPMLYFAQDWSAFYFNNLGYHISNLAWRKITPSDSAITLTQKLFFARDLLLRADNLMPSIGCVLVPVLGFGVRGLHVESLRRFPIGLLVALLLVVVSIPTSLFPTPSMSQYYSMTSGFVILLLIEVFAWVSLPLDFSREKLVAVLLLFVFAFTAPRYLVDISSLRKRAAVPGLHIHDVALSIRASLEARALGTGPIATLAPIYVIESGLAIYPQFSSGPFLYRIGDLVQQKDLEHFVGTSPATLHQLLELRPPDAVIVGFEGQLDTPFMDFATEHGYERVEVPGFSGTLYVAKR